MAEMQAETQSKDMSSGSFGNIGASANNAFLAPVIIASNVGLAAVNAAAETAARAARALSASSLPLGDPLANVIRTTADNVMEQARKGVELATSKVREATVGNSKTSANQRLAETLLDDATRTATLPLTAATAAWAAANEYESVRRVVQNTLVSLSSMLDPFTQRSVFPDSIVRERNANFREAAVR